MSMTEKLAALAAATSNEIFDADYKGGEWMVGAVETFETLEQFDESSKKWDARSAMQRGEIAGFPFIAWAKCQAVKGQERGPKSVIDFGDVRMVIDADLINF